MNSLFTFYRLQAGRAQCVLVLCKRANRGCIGRVKIDFAPRTRRHKALEAAAHRFCGGGGLAKGQKKLLMRRRWRALAGAAGGPAEPRESGARRRRYRLAFRPVNAGAAPAAVQVHQVGALCPGQGRLPSAPRASACQRINGLPAAGGSPLKMPTMLKLRPGSSDDLAPGARNRFI